MEKDLSIIKCCSYALYTNLEINVYEISVFGFIILMA